jgi:hypothetical protein
MPTVCGKHLIHYEGLNHTSSELDFITAFLFGFASEALLGEAIDFAKKA